MARTLYARDIRRLCGDALARGGTRKGPIAVEWDISGRCHNPYVTELYGRADDSEKRRANRAGKRSSGMMLELHTPCRKCEACLLARRRLWAARAKSETRGAARTWLGTLTLSPQQQFLYLSRARSSASKNGDDFDAFPPGQQWALRVGEIMPEITKFLKRIRKNSSAALRYLCVVEAHRSGDPHFHILLHEVNMGRPCRKSVLKTSWLLGFSDWKLLDTALRASYTCKYLSKDSRARVRASIGYGSYEYPIENALLSHSEFAESKITSQIPPSNQVSKTISQIDEGIETGKGVEDGEFLPYFSDRY